ncbi:fructosamine kinase family protein [Empedobacter stercoris]|uniref:Fructosamine kinase family protein n=1 Tax=Empedobacter falsenii TaxID=343874 RepID=A0ABY8VAQ2_9FLAO|nr:MULTISPECIES: fructosamine kinase family protein [Empedobacter]MDM1524101.1 fructosamine kinase family protein [Empedobacter sp. 225-1]MDM1544031.1 fructosamine kinase family protein [Empedobacter sp. 189-2]UWX67816.1 fructosamine kinase family protein [Empedobacter stercoris]WIH98006.1 fructosamine kinase family protein [Empedobacter falsenii]HJD87193.1 fructosamine kinase family protein [Empedobacter falsenii]
MNEILERLKQLNLGIDSIVPIKGGDINDAFRLESFDKKYFLKVNSANNFPQLFKKEARALEAIKKTKTFSVPKVIDVGEAGKDFQYLVLEWIESSTPTVVNWENLGRNLAKLHQKTNKQFGWTEDNYIAIVVQPNSFTTTWSDFYANNRILPMIKLLQNKQLITSKQLKSAENLCKQLNSIFPEEKPALIHGDFWNGNILANSNDEFTIIDPAIYYGHREMDIAIAKLFGGFDDAFFDAYQESHPLEANYEERLPIAQLFPLLIHAYLFEGYYVKDVQTILKKF